MNEDEEIAIIVSVVVGSLFLVIILSVSIYCCCGKRNKKNAVEKLMTSQRGSHLARPTPIKFDDSSYSKTPALFPEMKYVDKGHANLGSLPKVGSSGLWLTRTSMLGPMHSQARATTQAVPHSSLLRATSEPRLAGDLQSMYENNMRIYQSQQMPPLLESYEPWSSRDVDRFHHKQYQQGALRDPYLPEPSMFERNALRRSVSDAIQSGMPAPVPSTRRTSSPPQPPPRPQSRSKPFREFAQVHHRRDSSHVRPAGYPPSRSNADRRSVACDRMLSYNDNFIFRASANSHQRNDLDRGYNSSLDVTGERKRPVNKFIPVNDSVHPQQLKTAQIAKAGSSNQGHQIRNNQKDIGRNVETDLNQISDDQHGTQTTVTSGYDSARSNLVNDVNAETLKYETQIKRLASSDETDNDNRHDGDDVINNNTILTTEKHPPNYRIQSSSSDHTDIEAKHVTATAFQFLDNYLSDDDTSVIGSELIDNKKDTSLAVGAV